MRNVIGPAVVVILFTACASQPTNPIACTLEARPALDVSVVDSVTAAPIADPLVWVRDGSFVDTLQIFGGSRADGPYERQGTYDIHVEASGYRDWLRQGVEVSADECHVRTRAVTARLQPVG